jgi:predicted RND superfamily exporter protein
MLLRQELVKNLLQKAERARLPLSIKTPLVFSLHHDLQVLQKTLITGLVLLASSTLFTLCFFGQPSMALSVLFSCLTVSLGVLGYSSYLAIPLNVVTLNTLILGLCFTVITTIHFCYHFINAGMKQQNSVSRVQYAFQVHYVYRSSN